LYTAKRGSTQLEVGRRNKSSRSLRLRGKYFMEFKLHKDFSEIVSGSWNTLVEQSIADTPFSRYEYLSQWWKTLGGGE
jgi:hypothetical protein